MILNHEDILEILYKGLSFPDLKTLGVLKRLKNRKDDTIMLAIVDEIEREGFSVLDQTVYLKPFMPKVAGYLFRL